jgi:glycosyltransferase involved in cell wall biosynthesis
MRYAYFRDPHGNITTMFSRERLIRLRATRLWVRRLHEILVTDPAVRIDDDRAWIEHTHRSEDHEKGERNFVTLRKILEETPNDEWAMLYMGMQHFGALQWNEAIQYLLRFTTLSKDPGERWQAFIMAAKAYRNLGRNREAMNAATAAIREIPEWRDPYYEMAYSYQALEDWPQAVRWYEEAERRTIPNDRRLLFNPLDYDFNPAVSAHTAYAVMGDLDKARGLLDRAISIRPDANLIHVRSLYDRTLSKRSAITAGFTLAKHLFGHGEPRKALDVLMALPAGSAQETSQVNAMRQAVAGEISYTHSDHTFENHYFLEPEPGGPDVTDPTDEERWLLRRLKAAGAKRVLDIGIGNAQTALYLASNGINVVGVDIDPRRVKNANLAAAKAGFIEKRYSREHGRTLPVLERHRRCLPTCIRRDHLREDLPAQFWYGRAERIPDKVRALGPYDAVLLDGILHRVRDPEKAVEQAEGIGGHVLVTVPDGGSIEVQHPPGTLRAYDMYELEGLFVQRGRLVESHPLGTRLALEYTVGADRYQPPVVIFCGPGWEPWSPEQIDEKGLGGSETAVVHLAEQLVKRGLRVMVYAEAEGVWNGVYYRHHSKWNPRTPVWAFISWRQPGVFDTPIAADQTYLWMHDTDAGAALTEERAKKIDTVLVLSRWHRSHILQTYPFLSDDRLTVIGNGIEAERFADQAGRKDVVIYSSSPDRGLEQALTYWPKIRAKTGAELRIFYGWDTWDKMGGDARLPGHKQKIMDLAEQEGVVWRGRVGQAELAREMMEAKALFYPGPHPFHETFCITALEAQAAGCVPVTRDNGALPETNKHGIVVPNDAPAKQWVAAIQEALTTDEQTRAKMRRWAAEQTWAAVADRVMERSIAVNNRKQQQESKVA